MNASKYLSHHLGGDDRGEGRGNIGGMVKVHGDLLFFWIDASHSSSKNEGSGHEEYIREGK